MNKKYIIVSLTIFIVSLIFIFSFNFLLGDKVFYNNAINFEEDVPVIKYIGVEEDNNVYKIKVSIKNNSKYYATFDNISLKLGGAIQGEPMFDGYDNNQREALMNHREGDKYNYSYYFNPNEEREYVFEISKGLKFDKYKFSSKEMDVHYSYKLYKYRSNNNMVIGNGQSGAGSRRIETNIEITQ